MGSMIDRVRCWCGEREQGCSALNEPWAMGTGRSRTQAPFGVGFSQHRQQAGSDVALAHYETGPGARQDAAKPGTDWLAALPFVPASSPAARVAGSPQGWGPSGKGNHGFDHRPCDRVPAVEEGLPVWEMASLSLLRGSYPPNSRLMNLSYDCWGCKEETTPKEASRRA
jgi:hypothetical protein